MQFGEISKAKDIGAQESTTEIQDKFENAKNNVKLGTDASDVRQDEGEDSQPEPAKPVVINADTIIINRSEDRRTGVAFTNQQTSQGKEYVDIIGYRPGDSYERTASGRIFVNSSYTAETYVCIQTDNGCVDPQTLLPENPIYRK